LVEAADFHIFIFNVFHVLQQAISTIHSFAALKGIRL